MYVAEKYNVAMATNLEDILRKRLTTSNAIALLSISYKFNLENLKKTASAHIKEHFLTPVVDEQMKVNYFRPSIFSPIFLSLRLLIKGFWFG